MKFNRLWTSNTVNAHKVTPYVLVKHKTCRRLSYLLNRNYELIWQNEFEAMLPSEEWRIKRYLYDVFAKHNVQEWDGWTPRCESQLPEKCAGVDSSEFIAYWLDDLPKLKPSVLAGLLFVEKDIK